MKKSLVIVPIVSCGYRLLYAFLDSIFTFIFSRYDIDMLVRYNTVSRIFVILEILLTIASLVCLIILLASKQKLLIVPVADCGYMLLHTVLSRLFFGIAARNSYEAFSIASTVNGIFSFLGILLTIASLVCLIVLLVKGGKKSAPKAVPSGVPEEAMAKVREITELHRMGVLNDTEFEQKKKELLNRF